MYFYNRVCEICVRLCMRLSGSRKLKMEDIGHKKPQTKNTKLRTRLKSKSHLLPCKLIIVEMWSFYVIKRLFWMSSGRINEVFGVRMKLIPGFSAYKTENVFWHLSSLAAFIRLFLRNLTAIRYSHGPWDVQVTRPKSGRGRPETTEYSSCYQINGLDRSFISS